MRKRRIILSLCLAFILSISSLVLFGCGKKTSIANTYKLFDETMTAMKDTTLFDQNTTESELDSNTNFQTEFKLHDFGEVEKHGTSQINESDYSQYTILLAAGLNFIDEYYPLLKDVKIKQNYEEMDESIKSVKSNFTSTETAQKEMPKISDVPQAIYNNGYFYTYRKAAAKMIDSVYSCAFKLGDFLIEEVKYTANVGKENMTTEAFQFYFDYEVLSLYDDFRLLFMKSFEGRKPSSDTFDKARTALGKLSQITNKTVASPVTAERANELKTFIGKLNGTRDDARKATKSFSYYLYAKNSHKIESFLKEDENAQIYCNQIEVYFSNNGGGSGASLVERTISQLKTYCGE